jgi:transcriptional regulator with XRE-family HTH domain
MEPGMNRDLPQEMADRRKELGLSMSEAARIAGVHRLTWRSWEKASSRPEDFNHVNIERTLQWEPGSVASKLRGGAVVERRPTIEDDRLAVLTASRDDLVKTARMIEEANGSRAAEQFLRSVYAMRERYEQQKRGIEPPGTENRDVS